VMQSAWARRRTLREPARRPRPEPRAVSFHHVTWAPRRASSAGTRSRATAARAAEPPSRRIVRREGFEQSFRDVLLAHQSTFKCSASIAARVAGPMAQILARSARRSVPNGPGGPGKSGRRWRW